MIGPRDFIDDPVAFSAGLQALATIVLVGLTAWYVRHTRAIATAAITQTRQAMTPIVTIRIKQVKTNGPIVFEVHNRGSGPAYAGVMLISEGVPEYEGGLFEQLDPNDSTELTAVNDTFIPFDRFNFPQGARPRRRSLSLAYRDIFGRRWDSGADLLIDFATADEFANSKDWPNERWYLRNALLDREYIREISPSEMINRFNRPAIRRQSGLRKWYARLRN